ncbi:MAG: sigma-54 dependent transcriptional regulator [Gammaproteobacteria bacterium]|nr:sigma-54 dependent transcriptional regulator [Gammaproteobacteria bacterium]
MNRSTALVVDDEPDIRELLEITLARMDIATVAVPDLETARAQLARAHFDLCLTDMRLPGGNGIELVRHIQKQHVDIPVAVITAHGNMESAVEALKAGAFDFVSKPVDLQVLRRLVATALKLAGARPKSARLLIGDSLAMQETRATIAKLARSQAPVYISGESGTGKELVARLIHEQGPRAENPFVPVNCGAIPEDLMESEFFGHKKGSFTGAVSDKQGLFQAADGGTLFLDEVADLPLHMQVKLLRAIQEKHVRPVGAQQEVAVDARILCATHKDLAALVQEGSFRQDLYYRINVIELRVPSLRERPEDIPQMAAFILERLADQAQQESPVISHEAVAALRAHEFPGNVRELENLLERAMTLCGGETIELDDLGISGAEASPQDGQTHAADNLESLLDRVEKETLVKALEQTSGNKTAAAKLLGISFGAFRYRLQKLGLG